MKKKDLLLSFFSGILLILSFPSFDLEILAWVAIVPLFYSVEGKGLFQSFMLGFLSGLVSFLGILYWIVVAVHTYGNVSFVPSVLILLLLVIYLSCFIGTFTFVSRAIQIHFGFKMIVLTPFIWTSLEYLRSFLLTGFPWANLGHSQYLNLPFAQIADLTGVYGLSFMIVLVNVTLYMMIRRSKESFPYREALITALLLSSTLIYGYMKIRTIDQRLGEQPSFKIGLVQGNIDQSLKWNESFQKETLKIYERLSLKVSEGRPDLIIWPETATPFFFQEAKEFQPEILRIPTRTDAYLLFGSPSFKIERGNVSHYNSAYLASPSREVVGRYDKIHLVPFGEYVPLSNLLFFIGSLGEGIGNFKPGKEMINLSMPRAKFGVLICFEIIFPDLCRRFVKEGANFLVTITNDAWFGRTSAPCQHFAIAAFRAIENRVFVARAANTGISGFIDPKGRILKEGGIFTEEALMGTIRLMKTKTFYTLHGDVFAWICSAFSIILLGFALVKHRTPGLPNQRSLES